MSLLAFAGLLLKAYPIYAQSYQLYPAVGSGLTGASSACADAFSANVTCHNIIGQLFADQFYDFGSDERLAYVCQKICLDSLTKHRDAVKGACVDAQYYDEYEKTYWMPTYPDEFMIYALNMACLKRRYVN
jgi:hypothetical protein